MINSHNEIVFHYCIPLICICTFGIVFVTNGDYLKHRSMWMNFWRCISKSILYWYIIASMRLIFMVLTILIYLSSLFIPRNNFILLNFNWIPYIDVLPRQYWNLILNSILIIAIFFVEAVIMTVLWSSTEYQFKCVT